MVASLAEAALAAGLTAAGLTAAGLTAATAAAMVGGWARRREASPSTGVGRHPPPDKIMISECTRKQVTKQPSSSVPPSSSAPARERGWGRSIMNVLPLPRHH